MLWRLCLCVCPPSHLRRRRWKIHRRSPHLGPNHPQDLFPIINFISTSFRAKGTYVLSLIPTYPFPEKINILLIDTSNQGETLDKTEKYIRKWRVLCFFWFHPAPFTQFRDPGGGKGGRLFGEPLGLQGREVVSFEMSGVQTMNLEHQKRTFNPLHHVPPG